MIKYSLVCGAEHRFEAWFADSDTCDRQLADGAVACPICADNNVAKAPMAPRIARRADRPVGRDPSPAPDPIHVARAVRRLIESTGEAMGPGFAEEARRIDRGEAPERLIYGETTEAEREALSDEGIEIGTIPWVPLDDA